MANLDGTDDYFDSREVIERIEEIETDQLAETEAEEFDSDLLDEDAREEYDALVALREEATDYIPDFPYGETFIADDYFSEYAMDQLTELGYIPEDFPWWIKIDADATAENRLTDYTCFRFRGTTYWARS